MSQWSNFAPFGEFAFSGEDSESEKIYNAQVAALGPAFAGTQAEAETYADSMCFGAARLQIQAAGAQDDPTQVNYLISELEKDWRIYPPPGATLGERRAELAFKQGFANGALETAIEAGLSALLGSLFVNWRPMDRATYNEVTLNTTYPVHSPLRRTVIKKITINDVIFPGIQTVSYTRLLDDGNPILTGETIVVEPGRNGLEDIVTVTAATATTLTADFDLPHDAGVPATTGPMIRWTSNQRHSMVIVHPDVLANNTLLTKVHEFMRRVMTAVSTWIVCPEMLTADPVYSWYPMQEGMPTGIVTSFRVGEGFIGQTPIGSSARTAGYDEAKAKSIPFTYASAEVPHLVMPLTEDGTNYGYSSLIPGGASLTIVGAPEFTADGLSFNAGADFAYIDQGAISGSSTIVFRAKYPDSHATIYPIVMFSNSTSTSPGGGWTIKRDGGVWHLMTNSVEDYSYGDDDDQWHTFSVVFTGTNSKFYIDGVLARDYAGFPGAFGQILKLGGGGTGATKGKLIIRNVVTINTALSDANRELLERWATDDDIRVEDPA